MPATMTEEEVWAHELFNKLVNKASVYKDIIILENVEYSKFVQVPLKAVRLEMTGEGHQVDAKVEFHYYETQMLYRIEAVYNDSTWVTKVDASGKEVVGWDGSEHQSYEWVDEQQTYAPLASVSKINHPLWSLINEVLAPEFWKDK